ncbi:MAG TPA: hypothetical protein VEP71_03655, partial [Gallionella sp.]|nr:hypothetical protein [Gallionella sp.]
MRYIAVFAGLIGMMAGAVAEYNPSQVPSTREIQQVFPIDIQQFISDREGCDHFRGEPRDFDESYIREFGKQAEIEQAERAEFLERMTDKLCYQMDKRLTLLKRKYKHDKVITNKLSEYKYLDINPYVHINIQKNFPNRELIQQKLIKEGFQENIAQFDNGSLSSKLTIQINRKVDINTAQRIIEIFLEFSPKDIGVVILPKSNLPLYEW